MITITMSIKYMKLTASKLVKEIKITKFIIFLIMNTIIFRQIIKFTV